MAREAAEAVEEVEEVVTVADGPVVSPAAVECVGGDASADVDGGDGDATMAAAGSKAALTEVAALVVTAVVG